MDDCGTYHVEKAHRNRDELNRGYAGIVMLSYPAPTFGLADADADRRAS
jgi:hypothetical protein